MLLWKCEDTYELKKFDGYRRLELNLACCQLEVRHLYCLSIRVIVKPFSQETQRVFFKIHF